jgi:hypothetical protein
MVIQLLALYAKWPCCRKHVTSLIASAHGRSPSSQSFTLHANAPNPPPSRDNPTHLLYGAVSYVCEKIRDVRATMRAIWSAEACALCMVSVH